MTPKSMCCTCSSAGSGFDATTQQTFAVRRLSGVCGQEGRHAWKAVQHSGECRDRIGCRITWHRESGGLPRARSGPQLNDMAWRPIRRRRDLAIRM